MTHHRYIRAWLGGAIALALGGSAWAQLAVRNQGYIPFSEPPIDYRSNDISDPVALLQKRLEQGTARLEFEPGHGYLRSVLSLLDVPVDSQTLVFSKTSFQYPKISPAHPRALYFNDDVYVGSVHEGKAIEIVSFDARQGAIFYLLDERKVEQPAFQRAELDCTQCHIAAGTRGVPGVLLRSVHATAQGTVAPGTQSLVTDQASPFKDRWGGWFVTNNLGGVAANLGNAITVAKAADGAAPASTPATEDLGTPFDAASYLAPGSDAVALLVLAHQTQMHNLVTLVNYRTRIALHTLATRNGSAGATDTAAATDIPDELRGQYERPAEQLLRYLLFANEAPLAGAESRERLAGSAFAQRFAALGPRDGRGRSLRDFDLATRTFRYPCSYLIYSQSFDALPEPAKGYVYHRLLQVLSGADTSADFARLSAADRRAVLEILLATKPGLPQEWHDYERTAGIVPASRQLTTHNP
jgi:hypothetical protein